MNVTRLYRVSKLHYEVLDVGKTIKSSKKRHVWKFELDGQDYTIDLYASLYSGKKKVCANNIVLNQCKAYKGKYIYEFRLGSSQLKIVQYDKEYELYINEESFSQLIEHETAKKSVKYDSTKQQNDPYKVKDYSENLSKSKGLGEAPSRSRKSYKDVDDGYVVKPKEKSKTGYDSFQQDQSILNKYRNPVKNSGSGNNEEAKRKSKPKKKKADLNDSWDAAWEQDNNDPNQYSTYNQPAQSKEAQLEENFDFDEMKTALNSK